MPLVWYWTRHEQECTMPSIPVNPSIAHYGKMLCAANGESSLPALGVREAPASAVFLPRQHMLSLSHFLSLPAPGTNGACPGAISASIPWIVAGGVSFIPLPLARRALGVSYPSTLCAKLVTH